MPENHPLPENAPLHPDFMLQRGEMQFRRLLDKLPAGAYTCDPAGLITYYNQHAGQLWGRAPRLNDPIDRFCGSFKLYSIDGKPINHDQCWMALALQGDPGCNGREIIIERPNGDRSTVLSYASPLLDESQRVVGAVNILVDITGQIVTSAHHRSERAVPGRPRICWVAIAMVSGQCQRIPRPLRAYCNIGSRAFNELSVNGF